jgi:pyrroline-5-carboxylate reductase
MGEALLVGLLAAGWEPRRIAVVELSDRRRGERDSAGYTAKGVLVVSSVAEATVGLGLDGKAPTGSPRGGDPPGGDWGAVVAVKPHDVRSLCGQLKACGVDRVLSIAAGVTLSDLDSWLAPAAVIRAMPNTPALVGAAASVVSRGSSAGDDDVAWATGVLGAVGSVVELPEKSLDAVTGLSGSGPAYIFVVVEALIDAGVYVGLSRQVARDLTVATLLGSAKLLDQTGEEPSALRAAVTSPGGTTAAGLRQLDKHGLRSAILEAVVASSERAAELGRHD